MNLQITNSLYVWGHFKSTWPRVCDDHTPHTALQPVAAEYHNFNKIDQSFKFSFLNDTRLKED